MPFSNSGCRASFHRHASHDYCHPVNREHERQGGGSGAPEGQGWSRDNIHHLLQRVGPDSGEVKLRQAAQQLRRSGDPGLGAVAFFLAEAGDALHYGRQDQANALYQKALQRATALTKGKQLSLRARLAGLVAKRAARQLEKDIGAAGAPMTGGMVSTPTAGSGKRRRRLPIV